MQLTNLKQETNIQLKPDIQGTLGKPNAIEDDPNRTPGRDNTAEWINRHIVGTGEWPVAATEIEERLKQDDSYTGPSSRQHITNVLEGYFEGVDRSTESRTADLDSKPMSQAPKQPHIEDRPDKAESDQTGPTIKAGETRTVFYSRDGMIDEIEITVPENLDDPETAFVRGFLTALNSK